MLLEFIKDSLKLAIIGVMIFVLLHRYLRWKRPDLAKRAEQDRLMLLLALGAILVGIKISEDALTGDSGPADKAILLFIHRNVPTEWTRFFEWVTLMGSFDVVVALVSLSGLLLLVLKRYAETLLLLSSTVCGGLVIYLLKLVTGRERPALWETRWYWGTSFPSGHTLETACFAMALTLCLRPVLPRQAQLIRIVAFVWVLLVGFSRLVLGVHWPTDVLAAMCIGMVIPVALQLALTQANWLTAQSQSGTD